MAGRFVSLINYYRKFLIEEALTACEGNKSRAARKLDLHRNDLERWMQKLGISVAGKPKKVCIDCGKKIKKESVRCRKCSYRYLTGRRQVSQKIPKNENVRPVEPEN